MTKGRSIIPLLNIAVVLAVLVLFLTGPQAAAAVKEPFQFQTSDNETPIGLGIVICPGGIAINNRTININYFGELTSGINVWLYPDSYTNCFQEEPFMSYGANLPVPLVNGTVTQCYPLIGNTDTWYEAIVNLDLDGGGADVEVHRSILVPSDQTHFLAKYTIRNIKGSTLPNFRFFNGVDYDLASSSSDDEGGYDQKDFVWEHDLSGVGTYVAFKADRPSRHHDVNYYATMWNDIAAGALNDATYYAGDAAIAMEWPAGDLLPGSSMAITITFVFAPSFNTISSVLLPGSALEANPQPESSPTSPTPPPARLSQSILSTNYARATPQQTYPNQPVTISTNVINAGNDTGNYNVVLKINGKTEQSRTVSVGPGGSYPVKFTVAKAEPGTYVATIDGHELDFVVLGDQTSKSPAGGGAFSFAVAGIILLAITTVLFLSLRRS